ncbi:endothelin-2 [Hippoglossus stenolepis]|uniref:endothelin-2 n=1 Tax=Hippoglossus stenolepis TaxID=195615 RepID=UPI001FAF91E6|nr:endothelin-2 [Hippoglossus stenolepis]
MSARTSVLLFITLWASMQDGLSLPVNKQLKEEAADGIPTQRVRSRRCACSSMLDSECHYFCHLDIIWVNTPSKMTVYGLGSALSRRRRSTGRCSCAKPDDQSCTSFCRHSPEIKSEKRRQLSNTLRILRSLASRPKKTAPSHRGVSPEAQSRKTKR